MIHSADITFQMLEDWRNVDLNSITKQTLYTMEDTRDEHRKLIIQCKMLHQGVCLFICLKRKSMLVNKVALPPSPSPWDPIPPLLLFLLKGLAQVEEPVDLQGHGSTLLGKMGSGISGRTQHQAEGPTQDPRCQLPFPGWHQQMRSKAWHLSWRTSAWRQLDVLPAFPWRVTGVSPHIGR